MKNIIITIFLLVIFAAGALVCSALYFGVIFGAFAWLDGTNSARVGEPVGAIAGVMGPLVGVSLYFMFFWERWLRPDGSPDRVAQAVAVIVAIPLVLIPGSLPGPIEKAAIPPATAVSMLPPWRD